MLLSAVILTAAISLQDLPNDVIESFYWDCDTMFMKEELNPQDMWTCLQITEEFQKTFKSKEEFKLYWNQEKTKQWRQRGFVKK
jgi:hypothetical protein